MEKIKTHTWYKLLFLLLLIAVNAFPKTISYADILPVNIILAGGQQSLK